MEKEEPLLGIVGIGEPPAAFKGQKVLLHHRNGRVAFYVRLIFYIQKVDFKAIFIPANYIAFYFSLILARKLLLCRQLHYLVLPPMRKICPLSNVTVPCPYLSPGKKSPVTSRSLQPLTISIELLHDDQLIDKTVAVSNSIKGKKEAEKKERGGGVVTEARTHSFIS